MWLLVPLLAVTAIASLATQTREVPAEQVYRNIQFFVGRPASAVDEAMGFFNRALGVECEHCHVREAWHLETKPTLATARQMLRMVSALGEGTFADLGGFTCWTCHRGQPTPSRFPGPRLDEALARWPAELADAPDAQKLTMTVFAVSLGVGCEHCHVPGRWASLAKERQMTLTPRMLGLFDEFPNYVPSAAGRMQCWTCHKGSTQPERTPPPA